MRIEKRFEEDDPYAFVGVGFPCLERYDATEQMARTFIEEFAMMGFPNQLILELFRNPRYQGPHGVFKLRGETYVKNLIEEVCGA